MSGSFEHKPLLDRGALPDLDFVSLVRVKRG